MGRETEARCLLSAFRHFNFGDSNTADARCFARTVEKFGVVLEPAEMVRRNPALLFSHTATPVISGVGVPALCFSRLCLACAKLLGPPVDPFVDPPVVQESREHGQKSRGKRAKID